MPATGKVRRPRVLARLPCTMTRCHDHRGKWTFAVRYIDIGSDPIVGAAFVCNVLDGKAVLLVEPNDLAPLTGPDVAGMPPTSSTMRTANLVSPRSRLVLRLNGRDSFCAFG